MSVVVGYVPTAEGDAALGTAIREAGSRQVRLIVIISEQIGRASCRGRV